MTAPPPSDGVLSTHRTVLALLTLVVPALGVMSWTVTPKFDPFAARAALACLSGATLVATWLWPWARHRSRTLTWLVIQVVLCWFLYAAGRCGLTQDDAIGLLPLACVAPMIAANRCEVVATVVVETIGVAYLWWVVPDPEFPLDIFAVLLVAVALGIGSSSLARERLANRLREANDNLERRVAERTAQLAASLDRVERESAERARAERETVRASRAKSVFLANMSHELRTPLNAIVGYAQLVSEDLEDRPALREDLARVETAAGHLRTLIGDLLDLSRIEADELQLSIGAVALDEVVAEAVAIVPGLRTASRALAVEVGAIRVSADRDRLRQVLVNLLSNAHKFAPTGTISVRALDRGDRVMVEVEDTGPGIDPDLLPRIFDRFVMGDPTTTRTTGGAGLGLAISRELVERMGGRLEAESTVGVGTTFRVVLVRAA